MQQPHVKSIWYTSLSCTDILCNHHVLCCSTCQASLCCCSTAVVVLQIHMVPTQISCEQQITDEVMFTVQIVAEDMQRRATNENIEMTAAERQEPWHFQWQAFSY